MALPLSLPQQKTHRIAVSVLLRAFTPVYSDSWAATPAGRVNLAKTGFHEETTLPKRRVVKAAMPLNHTQKRWNMVSNVLERFQITGKGGRQHRTTAMMLAMAGDQTNQ